MLEGKWATMEDFATLFQYLWYQDFPISRQGTIGARQADWTKHIDRVIGNIANLTGFVVRFEAGGRTDAILRSTDGNEVAVEWEWGGGWNEELNKLKEHKKLWRKDKEGLKYAVLITYTDDIKNYCEQTEGIWKDPQWPLLLILVKEEKVSKKKLSSGREFEEIRMYRFEKNKPEELIRAAKALPWEVAGTRWSYEIK